MGRVVSAIRHVRGVRDVENRLEPHASAEGVPALQGGARRDVFELRQKSWSPGTRLVMGGVGAVLLASGLVARRRTRGRRTLGTAAALAGTTVLARSLFNLDFRRHTGVGAGRRAVDIHKSMTIEAPVEEVFAVFSAPENFPRFMSHVREVTRTQEGEYSWQVGGPLGIPFEWNAVVTQLVPEELIAWESRPGAAVKNEGSVRFERTDLVRTTLHVRLSYNPPAGAIGHVLAKLFRTDPKKQIDDDLMRFKSLLEQGKATGHETVTRADLNGPGAPLGPR
jgi:uncharacterized membrane protein